MKKLIYVGGEGLNFGRWRWIELGDVLEMTEAEAEGATEGKENAARFQEAKLDKNGEAIIPDSISKKAAKLKADRVKATSKEAEAGREERVAKENSVEKNQENELQNMTKEELRNKAAQLQGQGLAIDVRPQMSKKQLITEIVRATSKLD